MSSLDNQEVYEPRVASLLAAHLVSHVLDEAFVIVNAAQESGQPWRYLSMLRNLRSGRLTVSDDEDLSFINSMGDSASMIEENAGITDLIVTSTPQKKSDTVKASNTMAENSNIGQGDEEFDLRQDILSESTSMFINHLFNMSEVEHVVFCDDTNIVEGDLLPIPNELLTKAMKKIMDSYVNVALNIAFGEDPQMLTELNSLETEIIQIEQSSKSSEQSCYSFLADAGEIGKDIGFYVEDHVQSAIEIKDLQTVAEDVQKKEELRKESSEETDKRGVANYENAYLTLNRDYDQCSDDDDPVLQDPKGLAMEEVQLLTANTSENNVNSSCRELSQDPKGKGKLAATSAVSAVSRKSKSSIVSRCRSQGSRLFACLRGWWRRKSPGKRKNTRGPGSIRGVCPVSPDARRRAASILDQRLCSPTVSRSVAWKFNTVNEALVHSSRWKEYTFEVMPEGRGQVW